MARPTRPVVNGIADLGGVDRRVIEHFSDRRRQILEHLDEIGYRSARAAELVALGAAVQAAALLTSEPAPSIAARWSTTSGTVHEALPVDEEVRARLAAALPLAGA